MPLLDRRELVRRHCPETRKADPFSPFSVGNGNFAFTADITGLQTFPGHYREGIPLCTMAQWGWHSAPAPNGLGRADFQPVFYDTKRGPVPYPASAEGQEALYAWLRENPHRFHLGRVGFCLSKEDGSLACLGDLDGIRQRLDLWTGVLGSRFLVQGVPVEVRTLCHPSLDGIAVSVRSRLLEAGRLSVTVEFPYGSPGIEAALWDREDLHESDLTELTPRHFGWDRRLDGDRYFVKAAFSRDVRVLRRGKHGFFFGPVGPGDLMEFFVGFSLGADAADLPTYAAAEEACRGWWEGFWMKGGAVETAESRDPRTFELERRIVLSQYLTAIQCSGSVPSQRTGLTCNSLYGKIQLEQQLFQVGHFPLWGRPGLLARSLGWYGSILGKATSLAAAQGYRGARWPKMADGRGDWTPSPIAPFLVWQQPQVIHFAEFLYRADPRGEVLEKYRELVLKTAEFMVSFPEYDEERDRYVLGPPVAAMQEHWKPGETLNPLFELEYWHWGLKTAGEWEKRSGLPKSVEFERIASKLAAPPIHAGLYAAQENCTSTYSEFNFGNPSVLGAFGLLPGLRLDKAVMERSFERVLETWDWGRTCGFDYPLAALAAARLGRPGKAVDLLLLDVPNNRFLPNGHNRQAGREGLPVFLAGNGALLFAAAMMAGGWEGAPEGPAPGFPRDGAWKVRREGLPRF